MNKKYFLGFLSVLFFSPHHVEGMASGALMSVNRGGSAGGDSAVSGILDEILAAVACKVGHTFEVWGEAFHSERRDEEEANYCLFMRHLQSKKLESAEKTLTLIRSSTLINKGDARTGRTSLMIAASRGYYRIAEKLISQGAWVDKQDASGDTALHKAASIGFGSYPLVKLLLLKGASACIKNAAGETALSKLCATSDISMGALELLYRRTKPKDRQTEFIKACRHGNTSFVSFCLEKKMESDFKVFERTPLQVAQFYGHQEIIDLLVKNNPSSLEIKLDHLSPGSASSSDVEDGKSSGVSGGPTSSAGEEVDNEIPFF